MIAPNMLSQRIQRQIERLLDEADEAASLRDWATVRERAEHVLTFDPENVDARAFLAAAERGLGNMLPAGESLNVEAQHAVPSATDPLSPGGRELERGGQAPAQPVSFASGRYAVKRFLGEGGKKRVYLAHDTLLDRDVAFALIKAEGLDEEARERITREAQAMGRLGDHPHIVSIYDFGQENAQPYMVFPLLPGGDVADLIEKAESHQLPLEQAVRVAVEVCQGLEHAHGRGVLHRDVKPGNVVLTEKGTAQLADFGLAVAIDRSRLTQAGMMVGTVSYMPPEQALGGEITARSDLYSVGCMLYEMVTGRPPFVGDDSIAIIGQHLNTPPVSPSWHRPDLAKGLEALILRLLEKDPNKRPASALEVRQALAGIDTRPVDVGAIHELPLQPATDNPLYRRTFVGREAELRQLQAAFDGAMSGQGSLAMVVGEPGIGKTALVEQLATYVSLRGGRTLVGHCYEEGSLSLPYLAFVEAMRSYVLAREPEALKSDLGTGAADVARIVSEIRDKVGAIHELPLRPPGDPEDDRWRLLQAVTTFLRNAATVQPLLIVLEDLHWADRGTLDLLLHVARNLQGTRLVIVGTYRDVEVDRSHPLSGVLADLRRVQGFQRVPLRGLTIDEVQRMISNIRGQEVSWGRAEMYYRQTEGNPLFIQELLRYLVEEGLVVREGGRYSLADPSAPEAGVPEGLRDVIGKRLSRLSPECNRLLAVAAVIGRDFNLATLHVVAGVSDEAVMSGLEEAIRVGVLEERARLGAVSYRFAHAFFRQTLYEEMIAPRRLRLHQEIARALEAEYGSRREDHAAELAEHFANSTDKADLAKAVEYGEIAAQRAMAVFDYGEAVRLLERALAVQEVLDPEDKRKRCDLLLALAQALNPAGEPIRAYEEVAIEAVDLAEALGDQERAARACRLALLALLRAGSTPVFGTSLGRHWVERADRHAAPGSIDRVWANVGVANNLVADRKYKQAHVVLLRTLDLAGQLGHPDALFQASHALVALYDAPHYAEERRRVAEQVLTLDRTGVDVRMVGQALHTAATVMLGAGERELAEIAWEQVRELAERTHDPNAQLNTIAEEGLRLLLAGDLKGAIEVRAKLMVRRMELISASGAAAAGDPRPLAWLGLTSELTEFTERATEFPGAEVRRILALAYAGRKKEARDGLLAMMEKEVQGPESDHVSAGLLTMLLEAAVELGERKVARELIPRLSGLAGLAGTSNFNITCFGRHLGAAAALLGEPEQARGYFGQALEVATKIRFRPEIALTRLQLAELLLEHYPDERAEALEHLDFAISEFREMKMQPSLERALRHRGLLKA